jgi:tetratricopeptide (TPR) repeat protein
VTDTPTIFVSKRTSLQAVSIVAFVAVCCFVASAVADDRSVCGSVPPKPAAIAACTRIITSPATSPHDRALAFTFRAEATRARGDMAGAIADYSQALTLLPDYPQALVGRGIGYRESNDGVHATADFDQALTLNPKDARALYERGLTKRKSGDASGGDADIAAAKAISPDIAGRP